MEKRILKKPLIRKLGTIETNNIVETTPIVFKDRLYRFEVVRRKSFTAGTAIADWQSIDDSPCLRFVDVRTNTPTPTFADDHTFGFAYTENDIMYVVTCKGAKWGSDTLHFFRSTDLVNWELYSEYCLPGWSIFNMNIAKMGDTYTLLLESRKPVEEVGTKSASFRFATSKDLTNWELTPKECVFNFDRYVGAPALYTVDGDEHFYVGYLEAYPCSCYSNCLARSKDLIHWEYSKLNPVLMYDDVEDKKIGSPFLTPEDRERIECALNLNNSDMEFCEFLGRTIIYYSWGDQKGTEFLAEACYEGTLKSFLQGFFE